MKYDEFVDAVAIRSGLSLAEAEVLTLATLQTLSDRVTGGEAQDLASQLPKELQDFLRPRYEQAESFGLEEFVRRVANRAGVDLPTAWQGGRATLATLRTAISGGEFEDLLAQLPEEFLTAVQPAR
jgi:uncharacterized protein (DUF2267 family)